MSDMSLWFTEHDGAAGVTYKVTDVLYSKQSAFQKVDIVQTESYGRMLLLDGLVMTNEKDEFIYHELISHVPMLAHPNPRQVLVIGGGDGGTVREVLKHPSLERVVLCEIDGDVINSCREFLPTIAGKLGDPKVEIVVGDGAAYIANHKNAFDVIIIDSTDPDIGPGEKLFTDEFYNNALEALTGQGIMVAQSESPMHDDKEVSRIYQLLPRHFPIVRTFFAAIPSYPGGQWTWAYCAKNIEPLAQINEPVAKALEADCKYYNREVHRAVFALPNYVRRLTRQEAVVGV